MKNPPEGSLWKTISSYCSTRQREEGSHKGGKTCPAASQPKFRRVKLQLGFNTCSSQPGGYMSLLQVECAMALDFMPQCPSRAESGSLSWQSRWSSTGSSHPHTVWELTTLVLCQLWVAQSSLDTTSHWSTLPASWQQQNGLTHVTVEGSKFVQGDQRVSDNLNMETDLLGPNINKPKPYKQKGHWGTKVYLWDTITPYTRIKSTGLTQIQ